MFVVLSIVHCDKNTAVIKFTTKIWKYGEIANKKKSDKKHQQLAQQIWKWKWGRMLSVENIHHFTDQLPASILACST